MSDKTNEETEKQTTEQYWKNIELFINQSNKMTDTQGIDTTSSSLLYAAARFNAFNAASKYKTAELLAKEKEEAVKYFTATFKKMFQQNMNEYEKNFNQYFKSQNEKNN